ncbi:MAG: SH3 domain-containing protein [Candidatus Aminicenantia bacterium]
MKKVIFLCLLLIVFLPIFGESKKYVRVAVDTARVRDIPSLEGKIIEKVKKGTELEVIEQIGEWFRVYLPDGRTTGYISGKVVVEVTKEVEEKKVVAKERREEAKAEERRIAGIQRREKKEKPFRLFLSLSFGFPFANFKDEYSISAYQENGTYIGKYNASNGFSPEIGAILRFRDRIGFLFSIEPFFTKTDGNIVAQIPHPFYFERFRELKIKDKFSYSEIPINLNVAYDVGNVRGISFLFTGGLTLFLSSVEILESFSYAETYPYDEVNLTSKKNKTYSSFSPGFNMGFSGTYPIKNNFSAGIQAKVSFGKASIKPEGRDKISYTLGGFKAGLFIKLTL